MKNKYVNRSHISEANFRTLVKCFCLDLTAQSTANLSQISRNSINKYFLLIRKRLASLSVTEARSDGVFEVDESYFGARRVRGKRGRGALGKTPVFGLLKRGGKVFVSIVEKCSKARLLPIIQGHVLEGSTIYSDGWKAYDGLILNGYEHYRIHHSKNEFARGKNHINGIESFWSYAKGRMEKFKGITDENFWLHLKECEFRFNHRDEDLYKLLLKEFRNNPL